MNLKAKDKTEIVKIEPVDISLSKDNRFKKIGNKNALVSQLPSLLASQQLSNAYRIVLPPGTSGKLLQYKDGLLGTPLLENGKIVGHAGLESMSGIVSPMLIFTAMSFVTGQYFLSQINSSLDDIKRELEKINDIFLLKEESSLFSHGVFLHKIIRDHSLISSSEQLKIATLCSIQNTIIELSSSIYFYARNAISEINEISNTKFDEKLTTKEIRRNLEKLKVALDLRNMFLIFEFSLSQNFDATTTENFKNNISEGNKAAFSPLIEELLSVAKSIQSYLSSKATTLSKQEKAKTFIGELKSLKIGINEKYFEASHSDVETALDRLCEIDRKGMEYYISSDGIYVAT